MAAGEALPQNRGYETSASARFSSPEAMHVDDRSFNLRAIFAPDARVWMRVRLWCSEASVRRRSGLAGPFLPSLADANAGAVSAAVTPTPP